MNAQIGVAIPVIKIKRARTQWVFWPTGDTACKFCVKVWFARNHRGCRLPTRPFNLAADRILPRRLQARTANSHAVAHSGAIIENVV